MEDDWQFFGPEEDVEIDKARIVLLEKMIEIDPTIKQLMDMPMGSTAFRKSKEKDWIRVAKN